MKQMIVGAGGIWPSKQLVFAIMVSTTVLDDTSKDTFNTIFIPIFYRRRGTIYLVFSIEDVSVFTNIRNPDVKICGKNPEDKSAPSSVEKFYNTS